MLICENMYFKYGLKNEDVGHLAALTRSHLIGGHPSGELN